MNIWTLHKSTLHRNGRPVFMLTGVASGETTPRERRELREVITATLNICETVKSQEFFVCDAQMDYRGY